MNTLTDGPLAVPVVESGTTTPEGVPSVVNSVCLPASQGVFSGRSRLNVESVTKTEVFGSAHENDPEGAISEHAVVETFENGLQNIVRLDLRVMESGREFFVRSSVGHRFYVIGHGFEHAQDIPIGAKMRNYNGRVVELVGKELEAEPELVYNFEVEDCHTYFVGDNAECCVLGHNQDCAKCDSSGVRNFTTSISTGANSQRYTIHGADCMHCLIREKGMNEIDNKKSVIPGDGTNRMPRFMVFDFVTLENSDKRIVVARSWYTPKITQQPDSRLVNVVKSASTGKHVVRGSDANDPDYVGASGMGPCVGCAVISPNGDRWGFHFARPDDVTKTIKQYQWPKGTKAVLCGGDNTPASNEQLKELIKSLKAHEIDVLGVSPTTGIYVDKNGDFLTFNRDLEREDIFNKTYPNRAFDNPPKIIRSSR